MIPQAATIIPQNVEKLPLYHWRPGARLLAVGSRDGADFSGDPTADRNTFRRPVTAGVLREALAKLHLDGIALTWSASLREAAGVAAVGAAEPSALVVVTPGVGDHELLDGLLPQVDAWVVLATVEPQPLTARIIAEGRHVEVLIGLVDGRVPTLPWEQVAAAHLCAVRPAEADLLDAWAVEARAALPAELAVYDQHHQHSECRTCRERIVWRHSGRSRIDADLDADRRLVCRACGTVSPIRA